MVAALSQECLQEHGKQTTKAGIIKDVNSKHVLHDSMVADASGMYTFDGSCQL
jgi:hypothetical protein